jgi:catechol 2,3-dioxygenase-like lactoylglutathione lyase family enzyme
MAKVTGIGGVFFISKDSQAARDWYRKNLGIDSEEWGKAFLWREAEAKERIGYTVWSPHKPDTDHFKPSDADLMINYRVDDLDALWTHLKASGVECLGEVEQHPNGKFAWIIDLDGRKVELWEPIDPVEDPYLPKGE